MTHSGTWKKRTMSRLLWCIYRPTGEWLVSAFDEIVFLIIDQPLSNNGAVDFIMGSQAVVLYTDRLYIIHTDRMGELGPLCIR